jgi:folate-binding protein YgfZ
MPTAALPDRAFVDVTGEEAQHFLQNLITTDLMALGAGEAKPGALLSPQGKILFDFLVSLLPEGYRLDCRRTASADFARRLTLYRLRAKVTIAVEEQALVSVSWNGDSAASSSESTGLADRRFPPDAGVVRFHGTGGPAPDADVDSWDALRIAHGVAESGSDYELGDVFPHDVLLDQSGGVGFKKGCYVGQEVVSRMQHRGTARRRVLIASAQEALPASGTEITTGGRPVGTLGSVRGERGLAIVRIDKVKDAMDAVQPIEAGGVALSLAIPAWAGFTFPEPATPGPAAGGEA